jgi:hypothetical protein
MVMVMVMVMVVSPVSAEIVIELAVRMYDF